MHIAEYIELIHSGEDHKQDICDKQNDAISEKTMRIWYKTMCISLSENC